MPKCLNFSADWVSPPGDTIADILQDQQSTLSDFAARSRIRPEQVNELVRGELQIDEKLADVLASTLGASKSFWLARESQFRQDLVRLRTQTFTTSEAHWLKALPKRDMIRYGWIAPADDEEDFLQKCLRFFDVLDFQSWGDRYAKTLTTALFRTSPTFESTPGPLAVWLRRAEIESTAINCSPWNPEGLRRSLPRMRSLTRTKHPEFISQLRELCAQCGVALVVLRVPNGCHMSGATRFISPEKAMLALSCRHLSDDHFWFSFFHEIAHLLLHDHNAIFLEADARLRSEQESQADKFSELILIPENSMSELLQLKPIAKDVIRFARRIGVSPGIVVGQLQHHGIIGFRQLNQLKRRFSWGDRASI